MVDKNSIINILVNHQNGLKAKDIAKYIVGADRKSVNQTLYANPDLFISDSNHIWSIKKVVSKPTKKLKTTKEIKEYFRGNYIDNKSLGVLKKLNESELNLGRTRLGNLEKLIHIYIPFDFILEKIILASENKYNKTIKRTIEANNIFDFKDYTDWSKTIFSTKFPTFYSIVIDLCEIKEIKNIPQEQWIELFQLKQSQLVEIRKRIDSIKKIIELERFSSMENFTCWKTIIFSDEKTFESYINRAKQLSKIKKNLNFQNNLREIYQILSLDKKSFDLFITNFKNFRPSQFIEDMNNKLWIQFFLQESKNFNHLLLETQSIESLVSFQKISKRIFVDMKEFSTTSLEEYFNHLRFEKKYYTNQIFSPKKITTSQKQCLGDCGTCKRDKCLLDD